MLLFTRPYILIFLIFQGRVVEDPSITSYTRQTQKQKRRFTVSVLVIFRIVKKANNRLLAHIVVRAYGHIAVEHTCALRPSRTGRHLPPRPALQLTHAERTFRSVHAAYAEILPDVRRARVLSTRVRMVFSITTSHANCGQLLYPQT